jgi:cysteine-rich repeat protein
VRSLVPALALAALATCVIASEPRDWIECMDGIVCPSGTQCSPDGARCLFCGDGDRTGDEECEDRNRVDGDGCDSNCTFTACGNGVRTSGEVCDDGNLRDGDGCDGNCTRTGCGNGVITDDEGCDDGNLRDGDGCSSTCARE